MRYGEPEDSAAAGGAAKSRCGNSNRSQERGKTGRSSLAPLALSKARITENDGRAEMGLQERKLSGDLRWIFDQATSRAQTDPIEAHV